MRRRALMGIAFAVAVLGACGCHDEGTRQMAQNQSGAQTGSAVMPQAGSAAGAQTGNAAMPQDRNAATPQDRNAATPQSGNSQPPTTPGSDGVKRISIDDARAAVDQGKAVIFDVRGKEAYAAGHIPGSKVVGLDELNDRLADFPKDKLIITYCA